MTTWLILGDDIIVDRLSDFTNVLRNRNVSSIVVGKSEWSASRWSDSGEIARVLASKHPNIVAYVFGSSHEGETPEMFVDALRNLKNAAESVGVRQVYFVGPFHDSRSNDVLLGAFPSHALSGVVLAGSGSDVALPERIIKAILEMHQKQALPLWMMLSLTAGFVLISGWIVAGILRGKTEDTAGEKL